MNSTNKELKLPELGECGFTIRCLFVDLETSGFQNAIPDACVLSIGAALMEIDGSIPDGNTFYRVICPSDDLIRKISPGATAVNGLTEEILRRDGVPADYAWVAFGDWLKEKKVVPTKTRYIGQNPNFDLAFIQAEAPELVKKYGWVSHRVFDIIDLYSVAESKFIVPFISVGRKHKNGNNLAKNLNVEGEPQIHNALEGALLNYRNFTRLAQLTAAWRKTINK